MSVLAANKSVTYDAAEWRSRGRLTMFIFAVGLALSALMTFIAHNWAYLPTVGKLGGVFALLVVAAILWIWRGFDRPGAQAFGLSAQVLIGIWLAAAGQIYQAPGGLQDLLLRWALLGLPFAIASRSAAHWALYMTVLFGVAVTPLGVQLDALFRRPPFVLDLLIGAVFVFAAWQTHRRKAPAWLQVWLALGVAVLGLAATMSALFGAYAFSGQWIMIVPALALNVVLLLALGPLSAVGPRAVAASGLAASLFCIGIDLIGSMNTGLEAMLFTGALLAGGLTYGLVSYFRFIAPRTGHPDNVANVETDGEPGVAEADDLPWYMESLIALGGIVTAAFALGFVFLFIGTVVLSSGLQGIIVLGMGALIYALSLWQRRLASGPFKRFFFGTLLLAGGGLALTGFNVAADDFLARPTGLLTIGLASFTAWAIPRDRVLHLLLAVASAVGLLFLVVGPDLDGSIATLQVLFLLYGALGLTFALCPFRGHRHLAAASVFLISAGIAGFALSADTTLLHQSWPRFGLLAGGVVATGLTLSWARLPRWPILLGLCAVAVLMQGGSAPALLALLVSYALGSRTLFLLATLAVAALTWMTYFDLSLSLLELSLTLMISAAVLFALWAFSRRSEAAA